MFRVAAATSLLIACSGGSSPVDMTGDAAISKDGTAAMPDASVCTAVGACDWLDGYQRHIVGALSGAEDVTAGVRLMHRASVGERNVTRQFLTDALTALGYTPQRQDYTSGQYVGANVIATLDAASPGGTTIVVGAHFDGVPAGPAAADNATGVAVVLAAARYLRDVPGRTHPVVFALFDQEELGLVGSKAYAATLVPANVASVHIFDMLSYDGDADHAIELWSPAPAIAAAYQQAGMAAGTPISAVTFESSDHQAFIAAGFAATGVSEEYVGNDHTPNYHKSTDTYDNVSFEYLERTTHVGLAVIEAAVRAP
jgi:hypothetical protein